VSGASSDGQAPNADTNELLAAIQVPLGAELLERALMHRSYAYENGGLPTNERLEFLGDSVLGLVVTDTLYRGYPNLPEGQLAKLRVAAFADESHLTKDGANMFSSADQPTAATGVTIGQGMIEGSNVQPVVEISRMVEVMRAYQATTSMTQSQEDLIRQAIDKLGSVPNS